MCVRAHTHALQHIQAAQAEGPTGSMEFGGDWPPGVKKTR